MLIDKKKSKIGLLSFSDGRRRVHETLKDTILKNESEIEVALEKSGEAEVICGREVIWSPRRAVCEAKFLKSQEISGAIFNIPVFAFPNFAGLAAVIINAPIFIISPQNASLPGLGGLLAAGGLLNQAGFYEERLWGSLQDEECMSDLLSFVRATGAKHRLRGCVYGNIGGRSMGMNTGISAAPSEWLRVFGVDMEHVDQLEIVRRSSKITSELREKGVNWLQKNLGGVLYDGEKLTPENLGFQVACYYALKQIISERELDFVGVKCHYEMSEYYCPQCLAAAFLPFDLDMDGPKKIIPMACEADSDGALTMQILYEISGMPPLFLDVRHFDKESKTYTLCNCGAQSLYYSKRSPNPLENLSSIKIVPVIQKYGGVGGHLKYIGCSGELTFARLTKGTDGYCMLIFKGEAVEVPESKTKESCEAWPHIYVSVEIEPNYLVNALQSNHVHAVEGNYIKSLEKFCRMVGIKHIML
jgi:L-fucose isomerase